MNSHFISRNKMFKWWIVDKWSASLKDCRMYISPTLDFLLFVCVINMHINMQHQQHKPLDVCMICTFPKLYLFLSLFFLPTKLCQLVANCLLYWQKFLSTSSICLLRRLFLQLSEWNQQRRFYSRCRARMNISRHLSHGSSLINWSLVLCDPDL